jgi:hypothetical protein
VSRPDTSTPIAAPVPPIAAHTPSARLRSAPAKVVVVIDNADGDINAAPTPCTARPVTSMPPLVASPHTSDATVNSASPTSSVRRAPNACASPPPNTISPPNTSV